MPAKQLPLLLGSHMSTAGGVDKAPARGGSLQCSAMQIFVKNNNRWVGPPISDDTAKRYREELTKHEIAPNAVFAHTCYLINLAAVNPEIEAKSIAAVEDELRRCDLIGVPGLVMHPGAHLGAGREKAIEQIARHVRAIFKKLPGVKTRLLFEGTAGQGTTVGHTFEDLKDLLEACNLPDNVGICLDTCHLFAAGYDLRTPEDYKKSMDSFGKTVGFKNLFAMHLNDSKHALGSRKDRHEHIGKGEIGLEAFRLLLNDKRFRRIPMSLETDKDEEMTEDRMNLEVLRGLVER